MINLPKTDSVECEWEQGWLTVWFNQPERRNPLTDAVSLICSVFARRSSTIDLSAVLP